MANRSCFQVAGASCPPSHKISDYGAVFVGESLFWHLFLQSLEQFTTFSQLSTHDLWVKQNTCVKVGNGALSARKHALLSMMRLMIIKISVCLHLNVLDHLKIVWADMHKACDKQNLENFISRLRQRSLSFWEHTMSVSPSVPSQEVMNLDAAATCTFFNQLFLK